MIASKNIKFVAVLIAVVVLSNVLSQYLYKRFDLTQDKRYTIAKATEIIIEKAAVPLIIDVFLEGKFPAEFRRLQAETKQLLNEFSARNRNIQFEFINPLESTENLEKIEAEFFKNGLIPAEVQVRDNGKISIERIYPWAMAYYNGKTVKIPLLKNTLGATSQERVHNSIQNLEYAFADGFNKLINAKSKTVAVLKGNGELEDKQIASFLKTTREYYGIAPFILDSVSQNPERTLQQLTTFDLVVIAKPTEAFTDAEKYVLDQYIMNGGASLWLLDVIEQKQDPQTGKMYAVANDLGLNDLLFKYGLRINPTLVKDMYSAPIVLAQGTEEDSQYQQYPWFFYPLVASAQSHPIVTNIEGVKFEYAAPIDVLDTDVKKTVLLSSSPLTSFNILPLEINFDLYIPQFLKYVNEGPNPEAFSAGEIPLAVLLEGTFTSALKNRVKPFKIKDKSILKDQSVPTKMIVVSDGDLIKNQFDKNRPLPTGFDKMTQTMYGNSDFLLNSINYLLDDTGLINIRTKKITIPFLDPQKAQHDRVFWQAINLLLPLVLLGVFGGVFNYYRKRKYAR
ncbi:MAG: gliding-associated putative ABC transporter substrate-binding component GldG [Patiriisocius sp.]